MKRMLCIVSKPPYAGAHTLELVEEAMVGAVFDLQVSVLFRGEGVWSLVAEQDASTLNQRTVGNVLQALPAYEVEHLYVCEEALQNIGVALKDLVVPVVRVSLADQATLISEQDVVFGAQA